VQVFGENLHNPTLQHTACKHGSRAGTAFGVRLLYGVRAVGRVPVRLVSTVTCRCWLKVHVGLDRIRIAGIMKGYGRPGWQAAGHDRPLWRQSGVDTWPRQRDRARSTSPRPRAHGLRQQGATSSATAFPGLRDMAPSRAPLARGSWKPLSMEERQLAMELVSADVCAKSTRGPMRSKLKTIFKFLACWRLELVPYTPEVVYCTGAPSSVGSTDGPKRTCT
jgi:hypothetical protein